MSPERATELWRALDGLGCRGYTLRLGRYGNNRPAITIEDYRGAPEGKLTVNLYDEPLADGELFVKIDDPTAQATASALAGLGLIEETPVVISAGFVDRYARVWKLVDPSAGEVSP